MIFLFFFFTFFLLFFFFFFLRVAVVSLGRNSLEFEKSKHKINVLEGSASGSFSQVVDRGDNDQAIASGREREAADVHEVCRCDVLDLRDLREAQANQRLIRIVTGGKEKKCEFEMKKKNNKNKKMKK